MDWAVAVLVPRFRGLRIRRDQRLHHALGRLSALQDGLGGRRSCSPFPRPPDTPRSAPAPRPWTPLSATRWIGRSPFLFPVSAASGYAAISACTTPLDASQRYKMDWAVAVLVPRFRGLRIRRDQRLHHAL